uniref:Proteasome subunit alpha type n=1 Tax=Caenorhabditis tropicalis TaxID=1561998 RepID=A0A1I7UCI3_9PELO
MSSIGTGYDLAASTFSPDGRIFQVEYAQKAVDNAGTMIAIRGKNGIVVVADKLITSKLYTDNANPRMFNVNDNVGVAVAGNYPDGFSLKNYAYGEAMKWLKDYREPMPVQNIANAVAEYIHIHTLGISRPFGAGAFFVAWNKQAGGRLFLVEPSGLNYEYKAWAVGKHRQAAKAEIEKLKIDELDVQQLVKEAARIIMAVRDENKDKNVQIEMGWVGEHTNGKYEEVPSEVVTAAEEWASAKLDEDDMED